MNWDKQPQDKLNTVYSPAPSRVEMAANWLEKSAAIICGLFAGLLCFVLWTAMQGGNDANSPTSGALGTIIGLPLIVSSSVVVSVFVFAAIKLVIALYGRFQASKYNPRAPKRSWSNVKLRQEVASMDWEGRPEITLESVDESTPPTSVEDLVGRAGAVFAGVFVLIVSVFLWTHPDGNQRWGPSIVTEQAVLYGVLFIAALTVFSAFMGFLIAKALYSVGLWLQQLVKH